MATLAQIKGDVLTPDDPTYQTALARWAANTERRAKYIVFPTDTDDIALTLRYARSQGLPIVVRGGGHAASGSSSIEGGLVIDLSRYFNQARVDADAKLAYVGGGAVWATVDAETAKYGLATVGGTVNETGVGGLTLGGGYGWLTGQYGLSIDNLTQATVVLADGSVIIANDTSHKDLFWALRGAGPNFGVVTEFVFRLHPQPNKIFTGPLLFTPDKLKPLVAAAVELHNRQDPRTSAALAFVRHPETNDPMLSYHCFFNGLEAEAKETLKSIFDIGPIVSLAAEMPYERVNSLLNEATSGKREARYVGGAGWSEMSSETAQALFDKYCELSTGTFTSTISIIELYPSAAITRVHADATAFPSRGSHGNQIVICSWVEGPDATVDQAQHLVSELTSTTQRANKSKQIPVYSNYSTDVSQARELFGEEKYKTLQKVKGQYDPDAVFHTWFPIEPIV